MTPSDPTNAELLRAAATSLLNVPETAGRFERLNQPGLSGNYTTDVTDGITNNVGDYTVRGDDLNAAIDSTLAIYQRHGNCAFWWLGPAELDLASTLESHGFTHEFTDDALATTDLEPAFKSSPRVSVKPVADREVDLVGDTFAAGFDVGSGPLTPATGRLWVSTMQSSSGPPYHGRNYAAYLEGVEGPVAAASLLMVPGTPIALLAGASTLPEHRGNGAYKALIAARLTEAARLGARGAVIQANPDTSSPICQRMGMRKLGELVVYRSDAE